MNDEEYAVDRTRARASRAEIAAHLAALRDFMEGDVIIDLATADESGMPSIALGVGCIVSAAPPLVTVLVARAQSHEFLEMVAATRRIAVVFGHAPVHEAVQFKGSDCRIEPATPDEVGVADAYVGKLERQHVHLGFTPEQTAVHAGFPITDLVALHFTPYAVFQQTPGPQAGEPLK